MSGIFSAKFPGTCATCDGKIETDMLVRFEDDAVVHADKSVCAHQPDARPAGEICTECWVEKPVSGEHEC